MYVAAIGMLSAPKVNRIYHGIAAADVVLIDKPGNCAFNRVYCACVDVEITRGLHVLQWLCVCFQANCYIGTLFASPKWNFLRFLPVFQTHVASYTSGAYTVPYGLLLMIFSNLLVRP